MSSEIEGQMKAAEQEWIEGWKLGPQRLRWSKIPLQVGDKAPDSELPDSDGQVVKLSSYWQDRPALILFWRHYGCGCGIGRAGMLNNEYDAYVEAGANVCVIGQGEPEGPAAYAEQFERNQGANDIHNGIHRADLMKVDLLPGTAVDRCLGRSQLFEDAQSPAGNRVGKISVYDDCLDAF